MGAAWQGTGDDPVTVAARAPRLRITGVVPWAAAAVARGTLIVGARARHRRGRSSATGGPEADPLLARDDPVLRGRRRARPAAAAGAGVGVRARRLRADPRAAPGAGGGRRRHRPVERGVRARAGFEGPNEYLPALGALDFGAGFFVDRFAELVPSLPVHAAGHPPGLLLTLHALGIDSAGGHGGALHRRRRAQRAAGVPASAARCSTSGGARMAALLLALAPGALLFGATSADAVYLTLGLLAAWPLAAGRRVAGGGRRSPSARSSRGRCSPSARGRRS